MGTHRPVNEVLRFLSENSERLRDDFCDMVRVPSVSADPAYRADLDRCASLLAARMTRIGLEGVRMDSFGGPPVVSGRAPLIAGAPNILVYAHYDVQPADPLDEWTTDPFEPTLIDGEFRGRGASDDKAQVHLHLAAAEAYLATGGLAVNPLFVFEGEEEISSPHFSAWLEQLEGIDELHGCVVSDTTFLNPDTPSLGTGVRGLMFADIEMRTAAGDLHSGGYGGGVPNAAEALTAVLASLKDGRGHVTIDGFYDAVQDDPEFRALAGQLPFDEATWLDGAGLTRRKPVGEPGYTVLERLWLRPTLDINGVTAGYGGDGPKTVIPAVARAKISARLVPDQDPAAIFEALTQAIQERTPAYASVEVTLLSSSRAARVDARSWLAVAAMKSLDQGFGTWPVLQREGGSIPVVGMLAERLGGVPLILLGFSPPDDRAHAPNERMPLWNYEGGLKTLAHFWSNVSEGT